MIAQQQRQAEQDFILASIGGSLVPNSTHRPQDISVGLLAGLRELRDEATRALRGNLSGEIADTLAGLAQDYPDVVNAFGEPSDAVLEQESALVGDPDVLDQLSMSEFVNTLCDAFQDVLNRSGLWLETSDGFGVYAPDDDDDEF